MGRSEIKNALNRVLWSEKPEKCLVVIIDRLYPGGERTLRGDEIRGFSKLGHIVLEDGGLIPLHRVKKIVCGGKVVFERESKKISRRDVYWEESE